MCNIQKRFYLINVLRIKELLIQLTQFINISYYYITNYIIIISYVLMCKHNFQITVLISRYTTLTVREDKLKANLLPIGTYI